MTLREIICMALGACAGIFSAVIFDFWVVALVSFATTWLLLEASS